MDLRLTRRALDDLGLPVEECRRRSAQELKGRHEAIEVLVDRLLGNPLHLGEAIVLQSPRARFHLLHLGLWCVLLWHEKAEDTVWVCHVQRHLPGLAAGAHRALQDRHRVSSLRPVHADFHDTPPPPPDPWPFAVGLVQVGGGELVHAALQQPGEDITADLDLLHVTVRGVPVVGAPGRVEVWVELAVVKHGSLPNHWLAIALGALLPDASLDQLSDVPEGPVRGSAETVVSVCWRPWV